ncbi:hypothetical protein [Paraflavitalea pollutisoli]|uniref:hypothetical protein n=1 Tax=Paraflavitalea pollutisoli TaxID=3034143 RepID=UPI0023EAEA33|nr:hypothetical protein [Paraflavitalea sp. H1-2-19X]
MKYIYLLLTVSLLASISCKKDKKHNDSFTVTIVAQSTSGTATTFAATVSNPNPDTQPFLCKIPTDIGRPKYNCTDAVYLRNLPADMRIIGKRIRFTRYKDYGQNGLLSSIHHAHELDVYDPVEIR